MASGWPANQQQILPPNAINRLGERMMTAISPLLSFAMVGGLRKYRPIAAAKIGAAMVAAAAQEKTGAFLYEHGQVLRLLPEQLEPLGLNV
jgi:hypothetical protein